MCPVKDTSILFTNLGHKSGFPLSRIIATATMKWNLNKRAVR